MGARAVGLAMTLTLAGCGGTPSGQERAVKQSVREWAAAVARHDGPRACALLSTHLQRAIERHLLGEGVEGTCRTWAARYVSPRHPASQRDARITRVRIHGDRATVTLEAPGVPEGHARLVLERGQWRIDDF